MSYFKKILANPSGLLSVLISKASISAGVSVH